jgi:hypothetical protein
MRRVARTGGEVVQRSGVRILYPAASSHHIPSDLPHLLVSVFFCFFSCVADLGKFFCVKIKVILFIILCYRRRYPDPGSRKIIPDPGSKEKLFRIPDPGRGDKKGLIPDRPKFAKTFPLIQLLYIKILTLEYRYLKI